VIWFISITRKGTYPIEAYRNTFLAALAVVVWNFKEAIGFDLEKINRPY
jgi:hypothetical protein